ncbi:MAG: phytanoyl-CoA dioxygenase family protein [Acidimicrobiales bacterium]
MGSPPIAAGRPPSERRDDRIRAAEHYTGVGRAPWPPTYADPFPAIGGGLVEIDRPMLDVSILGGAVQHHGALIVRSLLADDDVAVMIDAMRRARAEQARHYDGIACDHDWFGPIDTGSKMDAVLRKSNADIGGVWLADSPRATERYLGALARAGVTGLLGEHFGEPPLISLQKSTMRSVEPAERLTTWHQDGAFMGENVRAMNLWVALTDCGGDTGGAGMEMIPRRVEEILDTTGGIVPHAIPFETVDEIAVTTPVVNPVFRAGDAIFFDDRFVHRTAAVPGLTTTRLAVECWFFAPSSFAETYTRLMA